MSKSTSLDQLRALAIKTVTSDSKNLTAINSAITELDEKKADKPSFISFTLQPSAWVSGTNGDFKYYANISVVGITASDGANVVLDVPSQALAGISGLCPSGETLSGAIKLWSKQAPAGNISGNYEIKKAR